MKKWEEEEEEDDEEEEEEEGIEQDRGGNFIARANQTREGWTEGGSTEREGGRRRGNVYRKGEQSGAPTVVVVDIMREE